MPWLFGILSGIAGIFCIVNLIKGPTCDCFIETPVQKTKLHPIARFKSYRKSMKVLLPLIEGEQGVLSPEEREMAAVTKGSLPAEKQVAGTAKIKEGGTLLWHALTFVSLSTLGVLSILNLSLSSAALLFTVVALAFVTIILSVVSIIMHHRQRISAFLKGLPGQCSA